MKQSSESFDSMNSIRVLIVNCFLSAYHDGRYSRYQLSRLTGFPMQFPIGGGMMPHDQQHAPAFAGRPTPAQYMMSQLEMGVCHRGGPQEGLDLSVAAEPGLPVD